MITGEKKVGHAGTLDPLASGVLVVGVGREATKQLDKIKAQEKEYLAKIKLGQTSTTEDAEGEKIDKQVGRPPNDVTVQQVLEKFEGTVKQKPPAYSAVKVKGQPAYKIARSGGAPKLEPREVEIQNIEIENYIWPFLTVTVSTSSGVYIRSLARDIGEALETGGYLLELERTRVGKYTKEQAYTLETFQKLWQGPNHRTKKRLK